MYVDSPGIQYKTPGQMIQALLDQRSWNKRILGIVLNVDETVVNKLISGKRRIDAGLALQLSELFGVPADQFLNLQTTYDLAKARIEAMPDPGMATRASLFGDLPVTELIKRRWLDTQDVKDVRAVEASLMRFFGVKSLNDIEVLPHAAKKTSVNMPTTPAQLAWLYRVREIASDMLVAKYSAERISVLENTLKPLLVSIDAARKVPRILMEAGIRFVIVEALSSTKIDGVCFWLDDHSPVIGMTFRYDRIDNFWFVLRHEIEHVVQGHGRNAAILDAGLEGERAGTGESVSGEERIANEAAADFCVPRAQMDRFISRKAPFFAERDILGFSNTIGVHPGLVAGQLQHRTGRYDLYRNHLSKIRSVVTPNAIVDGWGDVAPTET